MAVRVLYRAAVAALVLSSVASAQTAIHEHPRCGGVMVSSQAGNRPLPLEPRNFAVGVRGLCSEYATSGWEATMHLHLGEGASDFLPQIEMAVDLWNTALEGFTQRPVINIIQNVRPKTYRLSSNFWRNRNTQSERLVDDGQSVIYFKADENAGTSGFARWRWDYSDRLREADVYINTAHVVEYGPHLFDTHEVLRYNDTQSVYAWVDSIYLTVLHELGHLLGIGHIPVSGNIMSYNYMPALASRWKIPMALYVSGVAEMRQRLTGWSDPSTLPFVYQKRDDRSSFLMAVTRDSTLNDMQIFTSSVTLGEQDRMALMCIYDFKDWNH